MTKEQLLLKLTGTYNPAFITERESCIMDKCLEIINDLESKIIKPESLVQNLNLQSQCLHIDTYIVQGTLGGVWCRTCNTKIS
jgi:hypothetical protein